MGRSSSIDESQDGTRGGPVAEGTRVRVVGRSAESRPRRLTPEDLAWAVVAPAAALTLAAVVLLGPPLGHLLFKTGSDPLWPPEWWESHGHAEPAKHARYLLAVLAPLLLAAGVLWSSRRMAAVSPRLVRALAVGGHLLLVVLVAAALVRQHVMFTEFQSLPPVFGIGSVAAASGLALVAVAASRWRRLVRGVAALARETRAHRLAGLAIAACFVALWLLKVPLLDGPVEETSNYNLSWTLNDVFAVLDGRTPLVDYHPIYAKLLPFPTALVLSAFGKTTLVYTTLMAALDALALLAVFGVFRRVARSSLFAVALFVPFVAVGDIDRLVTPIGTVGPMTLAAMWPMRYGGAYLLAWLTARRLERPASRHLWALFLVGGLVAIDNLEFGAGAVAATVVALLAARPSEWRRYGVRLAGSAAVGLVGAGAIVCALTLVRAGALPDPAILLEWPRVFTDLGWFSLPLPLVGLHLAIYVTFAGAILAGAVRVARDDDDVLLTGMLLWSGVFGLAAGGYFVARPDVFKLTGLLSAWSFALTPLVVLCARALRSEGARRPQLAHLLVLFGFALSLTTLTRLAPQRELARLSNAETVPVYRPFMEQFVAAHTRRGETVAILVPMSFRIAYELGLRNVIPYPLENAIVTRGQMSRLLAALRQHRVGKVFLPIPGSRVAVEGDTAPAQLQALMGAGYAAGPSAPRLGVLELTRG